MIQDLSSASRSHHSAPLRYTVAAGSIAATLLLTLFLRPIIEPSVFSLFIGAVMVSAWFGGLGPGLLATLLAVTAIEVLLARGPGPLRYFHGYLRLTVFTLVSLLISSLTAARKRAEDALREAHGVLEIKVQERTAELVSANQNLRVEIDERARTENERKRLLHELTERVKELTALHRTAHLLQDDKKTPAELLREIVDMLPAAWQFPEITAVRIVFDGASYQTPNFERPHAWEQRADFTTMSGKRGSLEVAYLEERPLRGTGPFTTEELSLIHSVVEMIRTYFERHEAEADVKKVTCELIERNRELWRLQGEIKRVEPLAALGKVTATIAHELGTPLNSVLGHTQLLTQDGLSDSAKRRVEIIQVQVERMVDIINRYLTQVRSAFSQKARVNVNALVEDTLVMLRPIFEHDRVTVNTRLDSSLPEIFADGPSLQRVLINLLDNSVDSIKQDGIVTITTQHCTASKSKLRGVMIAITDTGAGIAPEILPRIFDMFVSTKPSGQGSGLGLAIVQEIVTGHGGSIDITSAVGKGTTARVFLPIDDENSGLKQPRSSG